MERLLTLFGGDPCRLTCRLPTPPSAPRRSTTNSSRRRQPPPIAAAWPMRFSAAAVLHLDHPAGAFALFRIRPPPRSGGSGNSGRDRGRKPPPKPEEKPQPPPQPDDERPSYDAPSAASQEMANRECRDHKTRAPAAKAEPAPNAGAPAELREPQAAQQQKAQVPPPQEAKPSPDADTPAAPLPSPAEADATPPAPRSSPSPPRLAPRANAPPGAPLPTDDVLPVYKFAHAATESPVVGGSADTRYFTIVYGMIRSHLHQPSGATLPSRGGAIVFTVDESGNLVQRKVVNSSGSPNLDMAVMAAIAVAAPYPAPPGWQPRAMRLTYGR